MHPYPYSSKFPPLTVQAAEEVGAPLPEEAGHRADVGSKFQRIIPCIDHVDSHGEWARQLPAYDLRQRRFAAAPHLPFGKGGVGVEDAFEGLWRTRHDGWRR